MPTFDLSDDELAAAAAAIRRATETDRFPRARLAGWLVGETLERALAALQRELAVQGA